MRAAQVTQSGLTGVAVRETARPTPADDEVLVKVSTVGVNQLDLNVIHGSGPGAKAQLPRTLGIDPAGTVVSQGAGVVGDRRGERIVVKPNISCGRCDYCRRGEEGDCPSQTVVGVHRNGGAADYVAVPSRNAFAIGELDFSVATAAVHSVPIAWHCINVAGGIQPGSRVLVTGASGAVGTAAVQLALHEGAEVYAAARSEPDAPGAVTVVRHTDCEDLHAQLSATAPEGFDLVLDTTGNGTVISTAIAALGWKGVAVFCAASTDPDIVVSGRGFYLKRNSLLGTASAHYAEVAHGLALVSQGIVQPRIGRSLPLSEISSAYEMRNGSVSSGKGKQIIHVV